jgi:predicted PurR-regulated permease PerM
MRPADSDRDPEPRGELDPLSGLMPGPLDIRSLALTGLFVLAMFYTLYVARTFLLPIVLAILLSFLFAPVVRGLRRIGLPEALGAAVVMIVLLGTMGWGVYKLSTPASAWILTAPESLRRIEYKVRALRKPVEQVSQAAEQVEDMATVPSTGDVQAVEIKDRGLSDTFMSQTQGFLAGAGIMLILLYFLLASGNLFLRKLVRVLPRLEDKKIAVDIARQIEDQISRYLASVTLINLCLGTVVAAAMYVIGMPNPVLWGVMVAVFNFVPYLGPMTSLVVLALVGIMTFDDLGWAMVPPAVYFVIDTLESNLVTPAILGRRLSLNPVIVFLGVTFWGWMWGVAGALLAVPMLAALKICCDEIEPLAPIGEFLGP